MVGSSYSRSEASIPWDNDRMAWIVGGHLWSFLSVGWYGNREKENVNNGIMKKFVMFASTSRLSMPVRKTVISSLNEL